MNRDALRWVAVLLLLTLLGPLVLYVVTGSIIGVLLPCSADTGLAVVTYEGSVLEISCSTAKVLVNLGVGAWGTALVVFGAVLLGLADVFPSG